MHPAMKIIPADSTIAELEKTAADCEDKAKKESEPVASMLSEMANLCREWVAALK